MEKKEIAKNREKGHITNKTQEKQVQKKMGNIHIPQSNNKKGNQSIQQHRSSHSIQSHKYNIPTTGRKKHRTKIQAEYMK